MPKPFILLPHILYNLNLQPLNHLGGGLVVIAWDQEVCSLCSLRFEPCGCSYDGHWRLTVVNFRARGISRGARKLVRTLTLN
jgi:hypothetical protein